MTPSDEGLRSQVGLPCLFWAKSRVARIHALKVGPNLYYKIWAEFFLLFSGGLNVKAPKLSSQQPEHSSISLAGPCQVGRYTT